MFGTIKRALKNVYGIGKNVIIHFEKSLIDNKCEIHKFINWQALEILKNDNYIDAYHFFSNHIFRLNEGAVWADKGLKNLGHFYNPEKKRGLLFNKDAVTLANEYYKKALLYANKGDFEESVFFLGAAIHLVQDVTIPHHANISIFDNHKQYERYVIDNFLDMTVFRTKKNGYYFMKFIEEAVISNAKCALKIYSKIKGMRNEKQKYEAITRYILPLAEKTTAGCFLMYYKDVSQKEDAVFRIIKVI